MSQVRWASACRAHWGRRRLVWGLSSYGAAVANVSAAPLVALRRAERREAELALALEFAASAIGAMGRQADKTAASSCVAAANRVQQLFAVA